MTTDELIKSRLEVCDGCDKKAKFDSKLMSENHQCLECGCVIEYKVKIRASKCPLNKW